MVSHQLQLLTSCHAVHSNARVPGISRYVTYTGSCTIDALIPLCPMLSPISASLPGRAHTELAFSFRWAALVTALGSGISGTPTGSWPGVGTAETTGQPSSSERDNFLAQSSAQHRAPCTSSPATRHDDAHHLLQWMTALLGRSHKSSGRSAEAGHVAAVSLRERGSPPPPGRAPSAKGSPLRQVDAKRVQAPV